MKYNELIKRIDNELEDLSTESAEAFDNDMVYHLSNKIDLLESCKAALIPSPGEPLDNIDPDYHHFTKLLKITVMDVQRCSAPRLNATGKLRCSDFEQAQRTAEGSVRMLWSYARTGRPFDQDFLSSIPTAEAQPNNVELVAEIEEIEKLDKERTHKGEWWRCGGNAIADTGDYNEMFLATIRECTETLIEPDGKVIEVKYDDYDKIILSEQEDNITGEDMDFIAAAPKMAALLSKCKAALSSKNEGEV